MYHHITLTSSKVLGCDDEIITGHWSAITQLGKDVSRMNVLPYLLLTTSSFHMGAQWLDYRRTSQSAKLACF